MVECRSSTCIYLYYQSTREHSTTWKKMYVCVTLQRVSKVWPVEVFDKLEIVGGCIGTNGNGWRRTKDAICPISQQVMEDLGVERGWSRWTSQFLLGAGTAVERFNVYGFSTLMTLQKCLWQVCMCIVFRTRWYVQMAIPMNAPSFKNGSHWENAPVQRQTWAWHTQPWASDLHLAVENWSEYEPTK
jgi:hypothetical protein